MANTSFRIALATVSSEPAEPPVVAWPTTEGGAPVVRFPEPTAATGIGQPAGFAGKPWCEFGRAVVDATGLDYYNDLFATSVSEVATVKVKLYNPRTAAWQVYLGYLWRPSLGQALPAYRWRDFTCRVTELVETTWSA